MRPHGPFHNVCLGCNSTIKRILTQLKLWDICKQCRVSPHVATFCENCVVGIKDDFPGCAKPSQLVSVNIDCMKVYAGKERDQH